MYLSKDEEEQSFKLALWYEVLATSFSYPWHIGADGQSSPSSSPLPTDSVQAVYLS